MNPGKTHSSYNYKTGYYLIVHHLTVMPLCTMYDNLYVVLPQLLKCSQAIIIETHLMEVYISFNKKKLKVGLHILTIC